MKEGEHGKIVLRVTLGFELIAYCLETVLTGFEEEYQRF